MVLGNSATSYRAEELHAEERSLRVEFRLPVPVRTQTAEIRSRGTSISQVTLPLLREADFLQHLTVDMPTVGVVLGEETVACQSYVVTQAKGAVASAVLSSATSLVPLVHLQPTLEVQVEDRTAPLRLPLTLSGKQLAARQALVSAAIPKTSLKHNWTAAWVVAGRVLAQQDSATGSARLLRWRLLRLIGVRYLVEGPDGTMQARLGFAATQNLPTPGTVLHPGHAEPGLAGRCEFHMRFVERVARCALDRNL